jgi:hypothetical protein
MGRSQQFSRRHYPERKSSGWGAHGVRYCYLYIADPDGIYVEKPGNVRLLDLNRPNGAIVTDDIPVVYDPSLNHEVPA